MVLKPGKNNTIFFRFYLRMINSYQIDEADV